MDGKCACGCGRFASKDLGIYRVCWYCYDDIHEKIRQRRCSYVDVVLELQRENARDRQLVRNGLEMAERGEG